MNQKIKIKYSGKVHPYRVGLMEGAPQPVHGFHEVYESVFSKTFLSTPNPQDLKDFNRNKEITWEIGEG